MFDPPKPAVFIFVLTAHLAILAFAFPHLEIKPDQQASVSADGVPVAASDAPPAAKSADSAPHPNADTPSTDGAPPVDHHSGDASPLAGSDADHPSPAGQTTPENTEGTDLNDPSTRLVAVLPTAAVAAASANLGKPAIGARLAKGDAGASPAEPASTPKTAAKPVTLAKVEEPTAPSPIPAQITTAKSTPEPAVVRSQPAMATSSKAGAGRMRNLRPLSTADR